MQCKDIPDEPILRFLLSIDGGPRWGTWFGPRGRWDNSIIDVMPEWVKDDGPNYRRLLLAKMAMLIRRGLVDGCTCGCRGDFQITDKGRAFLWALDAANSRP